MYSKLVVGLAMAGAATAADLVRRDTGGGGGHGHDHGAAHAAPAPSSGYSQPDAGYAAPSSGYSQPSSSYGGGAVSSGYGGGGGYEATGYEEDGFDLTAIIIPILIIFGLSLLFPAIVNVSVTGRKKRDLESAANPMADVVERVNDIYMSVVESEECMERIACEIGGIAATVGLQENSFAKMADPFVPSKYKSYYKQFRSGKNCHKIKCGSIY